MVRVTGNRYSSDSTQKGQKEKTMKEIRRLEVRISGYQEKIQELEAERRKQEQNYESLRVFKGNVEISHGEFHDINNWRRNTLAELQTVEANSITAQRYHDGMNYILNGIASQIIGCVYPALLFEISVKMQKYINGINDCDVEISRYRNLIENAEAELEEAKKEENNRRNGGKR